MKKMSLNVFMVTNKVLKSVSRVVRHLSNSKTHKKHKNFITNSKIKNNPKLNVSKQFSLISTKHLILTLMLACFC